LKYLDLWEEELSRAPPVTSDILEEIVYILFMPHPLMAQFFLIQIPLAIGRPLPALTLRPTHGT